MAVRRVRLVDADAGSPVMGYFWVFHRLGDLVVPRGEFPPLEPFFERGVFQQVLWGRYDRLLSE